MQRNLLVRGPWRIRPSIPKDKLVRRSELAQVTTTFSDSDLDLLESVFER